MDNKNERLVGVKAIAEYLNMSARNVYYWEKNLGLPIHRISSKSGYRIYAFKRELERWMEGQDKWIFKRRNILRPFWPVLILMVVLIAFIVLIFPSLKKESSGTEIMDVEKNIVYVKNMEGKTRWSFDVGNDITEKELRYLADTNDINDDKKKEIVACTYDAVERRFFISLFDHKGNIIWRNSINADITFNNIEIDEYFRPGVVRFVKTGPHDFVIISKWNHMERFLSIIASHDLNGKLLNRYYHIGNLSSKLELIDLDQNGIDEIVFTGTNNLLNGEGILGVLPVSNFYGISPPYRIEQEYYQFSNQLRDYLADRLDRGNNLWYLRFRRIDHLTRYSSIYINAEVVYFSKNIIQIRLFPWKLVPDDQFLGIDFVFDKYFNLHNVLAPPSTREKYREIVGSGEINISISQMIAIFSRSVFYWKADNWIPVKNIVTEKDIVNP